MSQDKIGYSDASRLTGIGLATLYSLVSRKRIPHFRIGKRLIRFSISELEKWMADRHISLKQTDDQ